MWKSLAIFGGSALIVAAILVAAYHQQSRAVGKSYDIKCTQPGEPAPTPAEFSCEIHHAQNAEQGHPSRDWWYVLIAWPDGITAWLLLLTFGAIVWQAWETRKAAKGALEGAREAQRLIDITILKEKPRIRIEIEKLQFIQSGGPWPGFKTLPSVLMHIYNSGGTKAFPTESRVELVVRGKKRVSQLLAIAEIAPTEDEPIHAGVQIMEETGEDTIWLLNTEQTQATISGVIEYTDVFENERRTPFRYKWISDFAGIQKDSIGDKVLYGQWEKDGHEENEAN